MDHWEGRHGSQSGVVGQWEGSESGEVWGSLRLLPSLQIEVGVDWGGQGNQTQGEGALSQHGYLIWNVQWVRASYWEKGEVNVTNRFLDGPWRRGMVPPTHTPPPIL